jgi:hypothetical protein
MNLVVAASLGKLEGHHDEIRELLHRVMPVVTQSSGPEIIKDLARVF